ncbi:C13 family peptidase [Uliginosibacterium gangwonense]|uniref:C13 family peptidase n=1 Tax=Uliginosibacterium gangwonense TaxID=392736 RepID=UPI00037C0FF6|nr:C13 family peptidase [Uliginosibacterium gangwonense]
MCNEHEEKNWLEVEITDAEWLAASAAYRSRPRAGHTQKRSAWLKIFGIWLVLSILGGVVLPYTPLADINGLSFLAGFVFTITVGWLSTRKHLLRVVQSFSHQYRLRIQTQGLEDDSEITHAIYPWSAVEAIELRPEAILIYLKGYRILWVPTRCFADTAAKDEWISQLEQFSGQQAVAARPVAHEVPEHRGRKIWADFGNNLYAGLLFALFYPAGAQRLRVSVLQIVLFAFASALLGIGFMLITVGLKGQFYWPALPGLFVCLLCSLLSAWAITRQTSQPERIPTAMLAIQTPLLITQAVGLLLSLCMTKGIAPTLSYQLIWLTYAWAWLAIIVSLVRSLHLLMGQRLIAVLGVSFLLAVPAWLHDEDSSGVWIPNYDDETAAGTQHTWEQATQEAVLYAQPALLDQAINAVQKGKPGVPELYLLALGGYGGQDVFLREARSVTQLFKERFDTEGHSITLINNPATTQEYPLASTIALRKSLAAIGSKMNKEEDVLFLFMTSHGAEDFHFSLDLWPYKFGELTPQTLRGMLDDAGIKNRVILVSACYSGGFVKLLANDNTLVMSASREDRNSHGCSHEAEWTFFGNAYFNEALRQTHSFEQAFAMANKAVTQREAKEDLKHSEPQMAEGQAIRPVLEKLETYQAENNAATH